MRTYHRHSIRLLILWLCILNLGALWYSGSHAGEPISLVIAPGFPRQNEEVIATVQLNNPSSQPFVARYQMYALGRLLKEGETTIQAGSSKTFQYAFKNPLRMGEQLNFTVKVQSESGDYKKSISSPPYPPQVWSSFISFASFSTSVMSSLSTATYYQTNFLTDAKLKLGFIVPVVLIVLLIFLYLTQPAVRIGSRTILERLMQRLSPLAVVLFLVFMGMLYTRIVLVLLTIV